MAVEMATALRILMAGYQVEGKFIE